MKIKFEFDATALTVREADTLLDEIMDAIEQAVQDGGFKTRLEVDKTSLKYIIEDV